MKDEIINKAVDKVLKDKFTMEQIENIFKPSTVGELLIRLIGMGGYQVLIADGIRHVGMFSTRYSKAIEYSFSIVEREKVYLAIKRRMQLTDTCN